MAKSSQVERKGMIIGMKYAGVVPIVLAAVMLVFPNDVFRGREITLLEESGAVRVVEKEESKASEPVQNVVMAGDSGVAGITLVLKNYYEETAGSNEIYVDGVKMKTVNRVPSPYDNLGIANVNNYVNIRSGPSTDDEIVGKLYKGCVANVLGYEGGWVKIQSGNVTEGYIRSDYLLIGWEAEAKIAQYCDRVATVNCDVLNVRTGMSTSDSIYDKIPYGESYYIEEEYEEWVKIILGQDDSTGKDHTGYVFKQYVDISYEYQYAITIEEEEAQKAAEEAARKAEEERLRKLAEEEAARKAAAAAKKKAEEEAAKAAQKAEAEEARKQLEQQAALSTDAAKLRQEIASYATKFVGNPYKWGGTSLTKGADCSGFVQSIYKQFGYTIPRVSKDQAKTAGYCDVKPDKEHLLPGDLVFYTDSKGVVDHVGIYIGDGKIVHAASKKSGIKISSYLTRTPYKARRIIK